MTRYIVVSTSKEFNEHYIDFITASDEKSATEMVLEVRYYTQVAFVLRPGEMMNTICAFYESPDEHFQRHWNDVVSCHEPVTFNGEERQIILDNRPEDREKRMALLAKLRQQEIEQFRDATCD